MDVFWAGSKWGVLHFLPVNTPPTAPKSAKKKGFLWFGVTSKIWDPFTSRSWGHRQGKLEASNQWAMITVTNMVKNFNMSHKRYGTP